MAGLEAAGGAAALFGIYAALSYDVYSSTNSSPQTTELFAGERSETLMKYVRIGGVQAVAFGLFGTLLTRSVWPLAGALTAGAVMHGLYLHANRSGLAKQGREPDGAPSVRGAAW